MLKRIFMLLSLLVIAGNVPAVAQTDDPEWTWVSEAESKSIYWIRTQDMLAGRSNQTAAPMWVRIDESRNTTVQHKESKILYSVNCQARTIATKYVAVYYRDPTKNWTKSYYGSGTPIIPGTSIESVVDMLCIDP